jgi:predicted SnoaL-like aldol condensation-catalyzing enzyme
MLNLSAANFWEWGHTKLYLPDLWETVKNYPWDYVPPAQNVLALYFSALNVHNAAQVAALYADNGVHVDGDSTVQGKAAIQAWYARLFERLPNASFTMVASSGDNSSKSFTWTASSPAGNVTNGSDSIGIVSSKIAYHYTFFTIQ